MGFRIDAQSAINGLDEARLKTMYAVESYGRAAAAKLEKAAKDAAPWTDRTGLARQTITGVADWAGSTYRIGVAGNMNYSPYLELARNKQYAVLWPMVMKMGPELISGMRGLL